MLDIQRKQSEVSPCDSSYSHSLLICIDVVVQYLHQLRNFSGMLSVLVAGLGCSAIRRLSKTWEVSTISLP